MSSCQRTNTVIQIKNNVYVSLSTELVAKFTLPTNMQYGQFKRSDYSSLWADI